MKRKIIALIVVFSIIIGLIGVKIATNKNGKNIKEEVVENIVAVEIEEVKESEIIKYKKFAGMLVAGETESVAANTIANIKEIHIKIGDYVKKGQTIMTLDSSKLDGQIEDINKASNEFKGQLDNINKKIEDSKLKIDEHNIKKQEIQKQLENLEIENGLTDKASEELNKKFEQQEITKEEFDGKEKELKKIKDENNLKIEQLIKELKKIEIEILAIENTTVQLKKFLETDSKNNGLGDALEILEEQKGKYVVKSKISGYIKEINFKVDKMPINLMKPGILIENYSTLNLNFQVSKEDREKIKDIKQIDIFVDNDNKEIKKIAKVKNISNEIDEKTNMYNVTLSIDNGNDELKNGDFAKAYIKIDSKKEVLTLSKDAIVREDNKSFVYVYENGISVKKPVTIGIENHEVVEVINGLKVSDKVINKGKEFVIDNEKVNIVNGGNKNENN